MNGPLGASYHREAIKQNGFWTLDSGLWTGSDLVLFRNKALDVNTTGVSFRESSL